MHDKTVLVIDDSATIRKLVDTHLSPVGYRVVLAPNAEDGLVLASEIKPDLILLDHQLPGTTGHQVATDLAGDEALAQIPVVISSTLRKKAYAEYIDLDNVVDMLPKPYTEELLRTTVANAIETAEMIVNSQSQGSAVPEIIHAANEVSMSGSLGSFGLRELLDFLNNGRKLGVLEIEGKQARVRFHLEKGRIQAVYAQGLSQDFLDAMLRLLPASLESLAPILKLTISGRSCAEVDGFVQLLDQKVLDPRLMTRLLRFQAALLVRFAVMQEFNEFRFESGASSNSLHRSLPLDISLLALLVEGAILSEASQDSTKSVSYVRRAIRGQNLDRAGLSARHMKILNVLNEPKDPQELAQILEWDGEEIGQVLQGFEQAELVERRTKAVQGQFVIYEPDAAHAQHLRDSLEQTDHRYSGKVVRDKLALQLVLKRSLPHTVVFSADDSGCCELMSRLFATDDARVQAIKRIAMTNSSELSRDCVELLGFEPDCLLTRPSDATKLFATMDELLLQAEEATANPVTSLGHNSAEFATTGAQL
ncbi:MAG: response regulator [Planctomycetota bacterium]